jgi:hypothetical protein
VAGPRVADHALVVALEPRAGPMLEQLIGDAAAELQRALAGLRLRVSGAPQTHVSRTVSVSLPGTAIETSFQRRAEDLAAPQAGSHQHDEHGSDLTRPLVLLELAERTHDR